NVGAILLARIVIRVIDIGIRSHRHIHLFTVAREYDVARPVSVTAKFAGSAGKIGDYHLLWPSRFQIANVVRKTNDRSGVAHVDPWRIVARWIKIDAEWAIESGGKRFCRLRLALFVHATKDLDHPGPALGKKKVAVGCGAHQARLVEFVGIKLHFEAGYRLRHRALRSWHQRWRIDRRRSLERRRQIGDCQLAELSRLLLAPIDERS